MTMDIRTLVVVLGMTHVVQLVVLTLQASTNRTYRGIGWWLLWSASAALGFPFIILRTLPAIDHVSIVAQNALIVLGTVFLYVGILRFLDETEKRWTITSIYSAFLASLTYFTYRQDDTAIRTVIICAALTATSLLSARALLIQKHASIRATATFCALVFLAHAVVLVHRATMVIAGTDVSDMFRPTLFNMALYLDGILASLLWTGGLIIMVNQRAHAEMKEARDHFELLFNSSPDGVVITRAEDGLCREANAAFVAASGYARSEILGHSIPDLHLYRDLDDRQRIVDELRQKGSCENIEVPFQSKDGRHLTCILSAHLFSLDGIPHVISVTRDITKRRLAETAVVEMEDRFRAFFDQSPIGHGITSPDGQLLRVNPALCRLLGYSADELASTSFADLTHPDDLAASERSIRALLAEEIGTSSTEVRYINRKGLTVWTQVDATLARDAEGRPLHLLVHMLDISERKKAESELRRILADVERSRLALLSVVEDLKSTEAALRESERQLSEAQAMAQLGHWKWHTKTGRVEWSDQVYRIFGLDPATFTPQIDSILALSPWPEDHERDKDLLRKAMASREKGAYEQRFLRPDGSIGHYFSTFLGKYDDEGDLVAIVGTVLDITERKRADEALRRKTERLQSLHRLDQAVLQAIESPETIAVIALRHLRDLLECQRASVGIFDLERKRLRLIVSDADGERVEAEERPLGDDDGEDLEALRRGDPELVEDTSRSPLPQLGSRILPMDGVASRISVPLLSAQGLKGALSVGWDAQKAITPEEAEIAAEVAGQVTIAIERDRMVKEKKNYAEELERRVAERTSALEAANEELEAFSYSVSHDLRAPLRAINGYVQILTEGHGATLDTEGQRVLDIIRVQAHRMGQLIDDLLRFSRFGRLPLRMALTDMTALVREVQAELINRTPGRAVDFEVAPLPTVSGDPSLLRQVWLNLLDNALKYTRPRERPRIRVTGSRQGTEAVFSVKDNGVGFDMKYAGKLFGVFQRLHGADEFEGTGVGLALVQRLVHRHGGRVWGEGEVDGGATFSFTLPIRGNAAAEEAALPPVSSALSDAIEPPNDRAQNG